MIDSLNRRGDVHGVDTGAAEVGHAAVVVQRRVDAVDTDGVDAELLEERNISFASISISQRVDKGGGFWSA